jgi:hypothetical protein
MVSRGGYVLAMASLINDCDAYFKNREEELMALNEQ